MSNLLKVTGNIAGELVVVEGHPPVVGWTMIMCEKQEHETSVSANQPVVCDMLRWAVGTSALDMVGKPLNRFSVSLSRCFRLVWSSQEL